MVSSSSTRTKVFISYSHKDAKYLDQLVEHLTPAERNNLIETWSDKKISAGAQWREEIKRAIEATKVAVLLISPSFLASEFIAENELPPLLHAAEQEGAIILPVIVRPSNFEDTELANFQTVNSPSMPAAKMKGYQRDELWAKVAREILSAIEAPIRKPDPSQESQVDLGAVETKQRIVHTLPHELPLEYEKQIHQQVVGMLDFRQAIEDRNWKQAEKVLQKYPNLPEGRSLFGLSMSYEVQEYFSTQLHPGTSPQVGGPVTPMYYTQFAQTSPPPSREAIHWLEEALQYEGDPEGTITAALALMYGYEKEYERMIEKIKKAQTINPSLLSYFQRPENLMMLIYACHDLASVDEVMRNVNLKLPHLDEVQQALRAASDPKNNPYVAAQPYIEWYAVDNSTGSISGMPVKVIIIFPGSDGLTYAQIIRTGQWSITIPTQPSSHAIETLIPVDEILEQLSDKGFVLLTLTNQVP